MGWTKPVRGVLRIEPTGSLAWFAPQNAPLLEARTVRENIDVAALPRFPTGQSRSVPAAGASAETILETFGLIPLAAVQAKHLSGGERQRVALARAALCEPPLLLADEVTAGLDAAAVERVIGALREIAGRGALVVAATHDPRVWKVADEVLDLTEAK
jgi:ABC-type lipoprotein export system ATPase subunit